MLPEELPFFGFFCLRVRHNSHTRRIHISEGGLPLEGERTQREQERARERDTTREREGERGRGECQLCLIFFCSCFDFSSLPPLPPTIIYLERIARVRSRPNTPPKQKKQKLSVKIISLYIFQKKKEKKRSGFRFFLILFPRGRRNLIKSIRALLQNSPPYLSLRMVLGLGYGDLLVVAVVAAVLVGELQKGENRENRETIDFKSKPATARCERTRPNFSQPPPTKKKKTFQAPTTSPRSPASPAAPRAGPSRSSPASATAP